MTGLQWCMVVQYPHEETGMKSTMMVRVVCSMKDTISPMIVRNVQGIENSTYGAMSPGHEKSMV